MATLQSNLNIVYILYTMFDQNREDIIDCQVEYGVHNRLRIYPVWHRHQIEETNGF